MVRFPWSSSDTWPNPNECPNSWTATLRRSYRLKHPLGKLERAIRTARVKVPGLPTGFRYHDLRHYLASMLIASGADVKVVQARLRHASAKTTLDTYAHLWPDADESTRAAIDVVMAARADYLRTAAKGQT
jgi:integrase